VLGDQIDLSLFLRPGATGKAALELQGDSRLSELLAAPPVLRERMLFPYLEGMDFVARLVRERGFSVVNAAYHFPPESSEQILHPSRYLEGDRPHQVTLELERLTSQLEAPATVGELGELGIRSLLSSHGENPEAIEAASGWGGDAYALFERDSGPMVWWFSSWDSEADATEFCSAWKGLEARWVSRPPFVLHQVQGTLVMVILSGEEIAPALLEAGFELIHVERKEPRPPDVLNGTVRRRPPRIGAFPAPCTRDRVRPSP
jgi:hypothetical protein